MKNDLLKLLNDILFNDSKECDCECCDKTNEKLDLSKDEDYEKFCKYIDECKSIYDSNEPDAGLTKLIFDVFLGGNMNELLDEIKEVGDKMHNEAIKKREEEAKKVPELPSKKTPLDKQAYLHKLVGEYVDTYIRPYGNMDKNVVDDVYAGLFEFACWVLNK